VLCAGCQCKNTGNNKSRANILTCDLIIIIYFVALKNNLHALKVRAIVQVNKSKRLGISKVSYSSADSNSLAAKALGTFINFSDKLSFHLSSPWEFIVLL
jgi:hypothetical protein